MPIRPAAVNQKPQPGQPPVPVPSTGSSPVKPTPVHPQPEFQPATSFEGANAQVLAGDWLDAGNPFLKAGVLDPMRRESLDTFNQQRASLDEAALQGGGAAFGGDMYQNLATRMYGAHQQQVGEQQNAVLAGQYNQERQNMMTALGMQQGFETAGLDRASQETMAAAQNVTSINLANISAAAQTRAAQISASTQLKLQEGGQAAQLEIARMNDQLTRDLQSGQLDFSRQQLALDALNSISRNELAEASFLAALAGQQTAQDASMLGTMGQMGGQWGQQQLGGFGQAAGLEQAGYTGLETAFGAEGQVNAQDSAAAAERARIENANAQARWEYDRYNGQGAFDAYMRTVMGVGSMGGTSSTEGVQAGTPAPAQQNPWATGLGQGLATFGALGGTFGGGNAPPVANPSSSVWNPNAGGWVAA